MLLSLRIENIALIDRLELDFHEGLTVLTGETGAGKSNILDAIAAVLGGPVTPRMIRTGADSATIVAMFTLTPPLRDWLHTQALPVGEETFTCRRTLRYQNSQLISQVWLNGEDFTVQQLEALREQLLDVTAQGQAMGLGNPGVQRDWLDNFGGQPLLQQREQVAKAFALATQAEQALAQRRQLEQERVEKLATYKRQLKELKALRLTDPNELTQLEQEHQRLSHAVELQRQSYQVYQLLYQHEDDSPTGADLVGEAAAIVAAMLPYDPQLAPIQDLLQNALALVQDAGRQISSYGEAIEADPQRLEDISQRISDLKQVCRKYGPTLKQTIAYQKRIHAEFGELMGVGQSIAALEQAYDEAQQVLTDACAHLTQLRQQAAQQLETQLLGELRPLAMQRLQFQVAIVPIVPTATGADQITFQFSPNPGEPLQPLVETASGGEMSRFLLALKACFSQVNPVGTLVFDEIDTGVSGQVTQAIANKLYHLGQHHQVMCVTHSPVVAAMADHHIRVDKTVITQGRDLDPEEPAEALPPEERTVVRVTVLDAAQQRDELVTLVGDRATADRNTTYSYVDSLLEQAARRKAGEITDTDDDDRLAIAPDNSLDRRVQRMVAALSDHSPS